MTTRINPKDKAKLTLFYKKLERERDAELKEFEDNYYNFCATLYPERDKKLQDAEDLLQKKIDQAQAEFELTRKSVMDEFENHPEVIRLGKIYQDKRSETLAIQEHKYNKFYLDMITKLGKDN